MKFNLKLFFCFIFIIFFIFEVSALGVTPARRTIDFSPSLNQKNSFTIVNPEGKNMELNIYVRGELTQYIKLEKTSVSLTSNDASISISYDLNLPSELSPGTNIGEIVISESSKQSSGENFIGATLSVVTQVYVYVPYPGRYAEAIMNILNADSNGDVTFIIPISNLGEFDLNNVYANVDVYSSLNEKISSFNTHSINIKSQEKEDLIYKWNAKELSTGNYYAKAAVIYEDKVINLDGTFRVGSTTLELQNLYVNNFNLGEIVKVDMLVENKWSEPISGARSIMEIYGKQGNLLDKIISPDYTISGLSKEIMSAYWDTNGVYEGDYDTKVTLEYANNRIDNNLVLQVSQNKLTVIGLGYVISEDGRSSGGENSTMTILFIVIGILVLVNLLWFILLRKFVAKKK